VFYLLYGPVEVALPVHVAGDLHGSAALLGTFWAVFGVGAVIGGPIVAALGARGTLLASALATVALALITAAILALPRCRRLLSRDRNAKAMDRSAEPPASEG
jgi:hypothetical protein